jgi:hypothetical protein
MRNKARERWRFYRPHLASVTTAGREGAEAKERGGGAARGPGGDSVPRGENGAWVRWPAI